MLGIDVRNSRELRATFLAIRNAGPELQKQIRAGLKTFALPEWQEAVRGNVTTRQQTRVLSDTAKVRVSNQNIRLSAGDAAKRLSGGAKARDIAHATEFGADRNRTKSYTGRRGSKTFPVHNRHTTRQFGSPRRKGYVVYQAAAEIIPRVAALAVQTVVRTLLDAVENKQ